MRISNLNSNYIWPLALSFILSACSSGGSNTPEPSPSPDPTPTPDPTPDPTPTATESFSGNLTGIEGLAYVSGDVSGVTDSNGLFEYEDGETLTFRIGDIVIGQASGADNLTLADFAATDVIEANMTRFLEVLDDDDDADNGILIIEAVHDLAAGKTINFDQTATAFVDDGNVQTVISTLTSVTSAGARMITDDSEPNPTTDNTLTLVSDDMSFLGTDLMFDQVAYGADTQAHSFLAVFNQEDVTLTLVQSFSGETDNSLVSLQIRLNGEFYQYTSPTACISGTYTAPCGDAIFDTVNRTLTFDEVLVQRTISCGSRRECEANGITDTVIDLRMSGVLSWTESDESE